MTFKEKLKYIAARLGTNPRWLYAVMWHESRLKPYSVNSKGCVGLIQFCPETGEKLVGYSPEQIRQMPATQQLDLVYKYFYHTAIAKGVKLDSPVKVFLTVFYPYALYSGKYKKLNYIIGSEKGLDYARTVAAQNPGLDMDKDGYISMLDFNRYVNKTLWKLKIMPYVNTAFAIAFVVSLIFILYAYKSVKIKW